MQQDIIFYCFLSFTVVLVPVLWRMKLLTLPSQTKEAGVALMTPLIGFLLFLSTLAYIPRWVKKIMHYGDTHGMSSFTLQELESWPQLIGFLVAAALLIGFSMIHSKECQARVWGAKRSIKEISLSFMKGVLYCLMTYPIVMTLVQAVHYGVAAAGYKALDEQVAIVHLKALAMYPGLFWCMTITVITIIPIIEELLFRGFLQSFFQGLVGPKIAIFLAALLFSIFHYSAEQGFTNIELMSGLFLYAIFLGIFYVRTRSLWVPIGMHAAFNTLSLFFMLYLG